MGIIRNTANKVSKEAPSNPSTDDQTLHTLDDSNNNETVLNTPTVMGESAGPSFLSDLADTSGNTSYSKAISLVSPLDLGIDPKIKGKIWAKQIELMDNGDGLLTCRKLIRDLLGHLKNGLSHFFGYLFVKEP